METKVRLLICHDCGTIEPLPWFDGPAEHDATLIYRDSFHKFDPDHWHRRALADVPAEQWNKPSHRDEIVRQITIAAKSSPVMSAVIDQDYYDVKANFEADAITCWKEHGRTQNCADYRADSKRLIPNTQAERRAEGLPSRARELPNTWLCNFCPVQSLVTTRMRAARGDYDKKSWEPT